LLADGYRRWTILGGDTIDGGTGTNLLTFDGRSPNDIASQSTVGGGNHNYLQ
jgi:hypothetical protein